MNLVFEKLNMIIKEYDNFILMGHKDPDLDSLGACLGFIDVIESFDKKAYLFLNDKHLEKYNTNINQAFKKMKKTVVCVNERSYSKIKGKTLLIILDVHIPDRLEYPKLLDKYDVVVLDHHIKSKDYIKNTKFMYIDTNLSSMSELASFYAEYNDIVLDNVIATILLAGIEIDTNGFNLKTTAKTYKAAAALMTMGADSILKQELLKESKEDYVKRANFIRNSFMVSSDIAMCITNGMTDTKELAEIAKELLTFEDVKASYAIGRLDYNTVGVSCRSLGDIDVGSVMKKLGGGGHTSTAAAQLEDKTIKEVKQLIINYINEE